MSGRATVVADDPRLAFLTKYKADGLKAGYGDVVLLFVGKDDCHSALLDCIAREQDWYQENMYSYDDKELNAAIVKLMQTPSVKVDLTLDLSQKGNKTETAILQADQQLNASAISNDVAVGNSATDQISHTKGGVLHSLGLFFEGSMNWSTGGEGVGIVLNGKQIKGFKAQNNTLLFSTNAVALSEFSAELAKEHATVVAQGHKTI